MWLYIIISIVCVYLDKDTMYNKVAKELQHIDMGLNKKSLYLVIKYFFCYHASISKLIHYGIRATTFAATKIT